jgi:hypothetical protein
MSYRYDTDSKREASSDARKLKREGYTHVKISRSKNYLDVYGSRAQYTYTVTAEDPKQGNPNRNTISLASLGRGIKAKWVKIRKVKNGIRVTIKK